MQNVNVWIGVMNYLSVRDNLGQTWLKCDLTKTDWTGYV